MRYARADDIFPPELLDVIQSYITDGLIYIPKPKKNHKGWGEANGEKKRLENRNHKIRDSFKTSHISIETLSDEYGLSVETIKNIVYRR